MISVVIPTHNRADLLPKAIRSVQGQTWKDLEIIVVSDGSSDNTKDVVETLAKEDDRIKFIEYYPAKGGNVARNTGIKNASGEYIAFLDDDDEFMSEKLEQQMAVMNANPQIGLVYTGVRVLYVNEQIEYKTKARNAGNLRQEILLGNCIGTTSTVLVRTSVLLQAGMFDEKLKALQDYDLWIRVCQLCEIGCVPDEMINYYNYSGTKQISSATNKYEEAYDQINKKYRDMIAMMPPEKQREKKYNEYIGLGNRALRNGNGKLARKYIREALKIMMKKKALASYVFSFFDFKLLLRLRSIF